MFFRVTEIHCKHAWALALVRNQFFLVMAVTPLLNKHVDQKISS